MGHSLLDDTRHQICCQFILANDIQWQQLRFWNTLYDAGYVNIAWLALIFILLAAFYVKIDNTHRISKLNIGYSLTAIKQLNIWRHCSYEE